MIKLILLLATLFASSSMFGQDMCKKADSVYKAQDYPRAVYLFSNIINSNQECSQAYLKRALCKFNLEDFRGSISDFREFIKNIRVYAEKDPFILVYERIAYYGIGDCYMGLNNIDEACINYSKAGELGLKEAYDTIRKVCR